VSAELDSNYKVVLSADVVGSTALYEAIGDSNAQAMMADCLNTLKRFCTNHQGTVLAEVGHQVVACFDDPTEAAAAPTEIHAELFESGAEQTRRMIRLRIGLHYGPLPTSGDVLSSGTAKIADWAAAKAKPEQTLATRAVIEQLPRIFRAVSRYVDDETWDFISLEHGELHEIIWDVESITAYNGEQPAREDNSYDHVEFSYGDQRVILDLARPVISIGRQKENDLVIEKDLVSRQHLSAQFSRGRCTITDNSTNGSTVRLDDGEQYELKRESIRVSGSGVVIPGMPDDAESGYEIRFRCV